MRYSHSSSTLLLFSLAVLAASCESAQVTVIPAGANSVEFDHTDLVNDYYTGVNTRQRLVLRDETAWANFWSQVVANRMPPPPRPEIDFASEMVIAAAMGGRPTGGYSIAIDAVYDADGRLYVVVRETSPGSSCFTTQAFTAPLNAVRIPRFEGEVVFAEKTETHECQ